MLAIYKIKYRSNGITITDIYNTIVNLKDKKL